MTISDPKENELIVPDPINSIQAQIDAYHEGKQEPSRGHMGASLLGHPCDRWLWLNFRWVIQQKFPGRILRLFRRGQLEEATIIQDLRAIGIDVRGSQTAVKFDAHVSGSADAIAASGVPESPSKPHVLEFKTHSLKSFNDVCKNGVEKSKFEHFIQMQIYMLGLGLERALYVAVCKDDDRMYTERVKLDKDVAEKFVQRGQRIALDDRMPPPISTDASWYQCKFCPAHKFCHSGELPKQFSCRTCAHATAKEDSTWRCEKHQADGIPVEFQRKGCDQGTIHPDIVPWKYSTERDYVIWHTPFGDIAQGNPDANIYAASEVLANPQACAAGDATGIREAFDAKVIG
jgi:hypothetical protein